MRYLLIPILCLSFIYSYDINWIEDEERKIFNKNKNIKSITINNYEIEEKFGEKVETRTSYQYESFKYDVNNLIIKKNCSSSSSRMSGPDSIITYIYDSNKNLIKKSIEGNTYNTDYNKLVSVWKYKYDEQNNLINSIEYYGTGGFAQEYAFQYDSLNRLKKADKNGMIQIYMYNSNDNLNELIEYRSNRPDEKF